MHIIGVDEAGRGAIIGDVVAGAVILPEQYDLPELTDSKALTEVKREALALEIKSQAIAWGIGTCSPEEIAQLNIHHASLRAMQRAVEALLVNLEANVEISEVWADGKFPPPLPTQLAKCDVISKAFVKGDFLYPCISGASILAKTTRDAMMREMDEKYPEYGFAQHKGYPTKQHQDALKTHGILPEHRQNYKTIKNLQLTLPL